MREEIWCEQEEPSLPVGGQALVGCPNRIVRKQRREIEVLVEGGWLRRNNAGRQRWIFHECIEWMRSISRRAEGMKERRKREDTTPLLHY